MFEKPSCCLIVTCTLLLFEFAIAADADETRWKVGLASAQITPQNPVRLAGYAGRKEPCVGVASHLFAKSLALEDSAGQQAVIVTADLLGFRGDLADKICSDIEAKTGLLRHQILLNSSHTHTGPNITLDTSKLDDFADEDKAATVGYTKSVVDNVVSIVERSLANMRPAVISRGVGVAKFVMNRREFTANGVILGFNPRGHVDRSVPVVRIDSPDGTLRAILFGAACHNTTLTGKHLEISGDFAGYAQTELERTHPGVQAMFMQGCAGDANPFPRGSEGIARQHGKNLAAEVQRVLESELESVSGPLRIAHANVEIPLQSQLSRDEINAIAQGRGGWRGFVTGSMLDTLEKNGELPDAYSTPMAVWQFGSDFTLVALSGEVVVDYVTSIERAIGPRGLWVAAYCNDVWGYLPSARILEEGGYETRGLYAGSVGLIDPSAQEVVVNHVRKLAAQARSKRP